MYYLSFIIVLVSSVMYHLTQKSISDKVNPAASMIVTYLLALIFSVLLFLFTSKNGWASFKQVNYASYLLGLVIFGIEIGYLYLYRTGWTLSTASIIANVATGLILLLIGALIFKEDLTSTNIIGIIISIVGLMLIRH